MPTAYILSSLKSDAKAKSIAKVFARLGFSNKILGKEVISPERVNMLEKQMGMNDGPKIEYADAVHLAIKGTTRNDVIVATEEWHELCFRGLLSLHHGMFSHAPVVHMWNDSPRYFARWNIFTSRFAMYHNAALGSVSFTNEWITANPFVEINKRTNNHLLLPKVYSSSDDPFSTAFLDDMSAGVPVIAPDWGAWSEHIVHGVNGYLYRSVEGEHNARNAADRLPSTDVTAWMKEKYSLEAATEQVARFLTALAAPA